MRRTRITLAAMVAASLVLAGCGGDDGGGGDDPKGTGEAAVLSSTWPLTGLDVKGNESAAQKHPAYVVKIDNTGASNPQVGLSKADMVVEELVEGGSTRLAVFYYSQLPESTGPVRSMRASDIGIVSPVDGVMVTSGAAGQTIARLDKAGVTFHQEGSAGFSRDSGRSAPYNLMANLKQLAKDDQGDEARPDDYLPWGDAGDLPKGQPATSVSASFSAGHSTTWSFQGGKYHNDNTYAAEGDAFEADSVLTLRVKVGDAGYTDPAGNPVPETTFEGKGEAMLFHNGRAVRGTWEKDGLEGALKLSTKNGDLTVPSGKTWIELIPADGGDVSFK